MSDDISRKNIHIITHSQLLKTLTSYHPSDKRPVPLKATNHADCNAPPVKANRQKI